MWLSFLIIFKIIGSVAVLFVLPFILVAFKMFPQQDKLFQIYVSMIIGLFISVALVYLLAVFNVFNKANFLVGYSLIILVFNAYFLRKMRQFKISLKIKLSSTFFLLLFAFCVGGYMRLYDPTKHIALGNVDFYRHLYFLKNTAKGIVFASYPRGFHIILALIYFVSNVDFYDIIRFAGALFGILSIGAVYCFMKQTFSKGAGIFAALFYSGFTIFNLLTVEQTGSWPTGFCFLLIPLLFYFALRLVSNFRENNIEKRNLLMFIAIIFLISLIAPYVMLQMSYILYFILFFSIAFYADIRKYFKKIGALIILFSLGISIVFSYYTILSKVRNISVSMPVYNEAKIEAKIIEVPEGVKGISNKWKIMEESVEFVKGISNKWKIIKSILYIKRVRIPVPFPLSIGVCIGLLLSALVVVFSCIKRNLKYSTIGIFPFLFGISCLTGILELPYYRGRAGWYFMLGSIWLGGVIVKRFYEQKLIRDAFQFLRKVIPLKIVNKIKSIEKSKASLIYLVVTLSILAGYLVIDWRAGLCKFNLIRGILFLLLILGTVFIIGKRKKSVLPEGKLLHFSNKNPYINLHKVLVSIAILAVMLHPLPTLPEYNFRYYHRSVNEDDFVKVVLKVKNEYPVSEVEMFFDNNIVYSANGKVKNIFYPQKIEIAEPKDILDFFQREFANRELPKSRNNKKIASSFEVDNKKYNFLFLDRGKGKSEAIENIKKLISIYKQHHHKARVFYKSENIIVYRF